MSDTAGWTFGLKKAALGIYQEGQNLYAACLIKKGNEIDIVFADAINLAETSQAEVSSAPATDKQGNGKKMDGDQRGKPSGDLDLGFDDDLSELIGDSALSQSEELQDDLQKDILKESSSAGSDTPFYAKGNDRYSSSFTSALNKIIHGAQRPVKLAFTLQEPDLYYAIFFSRWGLDGDKLKRRIIEELAKENPEASNLRDEQIQLMNTASGGTLAVVYESSDSFHKMYGDYESIYNSRLPNVAFIESADISLVNLVNLNYHFKPEEITVLVYVGNEFSRLIFMQGQQILHISPRLDEGIDSIIIFDSIYNRIILEQDSLNIPKIHRILTAGEAKDMGVKYYLSRMFPNDKQIKVDDLQLKNLSVSDRKLFPGEKISRLAIPIGNAWRILDEKNKGLIKLDLLPAKVKERQKIHKLGLGGWLVLILLFLSTWFFTFRIGALQIKLVERQTQVQIKTLELDNLLEIEKELNKAAEKLGYYKKTYSVLDSMMSQTKNWNGFVKRISDVAVQVGQSWVTDAIPNPNRTVTIKGYTLYRNRIAQFSDAIGSAVLKKVESAEIRAQTVYAFELLADVPDKKYVTPAVATANAASGKTEGVKKAEFRPDQKAQSKAAISSSEKKQTLQINDEKAFESYYQKARSLFSAYQYKEAIDLFTQLIETKYPSPLVVNCYYWMGESYFGIQQYQKAIDHLKQVVAQESSKKTAALYMIGKSYVALGNKQEARNYLDQLINGFPQDPLVSKAQNLRDRLQ